MTALATGRDALAAYAQALWAPRDLIEIRPLPPNSGRRCWLRAEELPDQFERLEAENAAGANLYAGVLPRRADGGGADADCLPGMVVWLDFDHVEPRNAWRRVVGRGLPKPTLVVNSGHGAHVYYGLTERADSAEIVALVHDLAVYVGSDPAVANASRILRLPGFLNHKAPPAPCELLHVDEAARYSLQALREAVPPPEVPRPAPDAPTATVGPSTGAVERARRYVATVPGAAEGGRSAPAYRVACVLSRDFALPDGDAWPILAGWNSAANRPPLDDRELRGILRNAAHYGKKPTGCRADGRPRPDRRDTEDRDAPQTPIVVPNGLTLGLEFDAERRGERRAVPLPWPRLDVAFGGALRPGTLTILAGPAGHGKSFMALQAAVHVRRQGERFALLPLEDRRVDVERRLLAHLAGTWDVLSLSPETVGDRESLLVKHEAELADLAQGVCENPRLPILDAEGRPTVPPLLYGRVLDWVAEALSRARVVAVDPLAQIDFGERDTWRGEKDFVRRLVALAADSGGSIVLVAHTVKRPGKAGTLQITGEDVQGAAEIRRLAHNVLLLDAHEPRDGEVWRDCGGRTVVRHARTVIVDKARNGPGPGSRIAVEMDGPCFRELGLLAMKGQA